MPAQTASDTQLLFVDAFGVTALTPPRKAATLGSSSPRTRSAFGAGWREHLSVDAAGARLAVYQPTSLHVGLVLYDLPSLKPLRELSGRWSGAHLMADGHHLLTAQRTSESDGAFDLYDLARDPASTREYLAHDDRVLRVEWSSLREGAVDAGSVDALGGRRRDPTPWRNAPSCFAVARDGAFVFYDGDAGLAWVGRVDPTSPRSGVTVHAVVGLPLWQGFRVAVYPSSRRPLLVAHDAGTLRAHAVPLPGDEPTPDALRPFELPAAALPARHGEMLFYQHADALDRVVRLDLDAGREERIEVAVERVAGGRRGAEVPAAWREPGAGRVLLGPQGEPYLLPWRAEAVIDLAARAAVPRKLPEAQATLAPPFCDALRRARDAGRAGGVAVDLESVRTQTIRYGKGRSAEHAFYQWAVMPGDGGLASLVLRSALWAGETVRSRLAAALPGLEVGVTTSHYPAELRPRRTFDLDELSRALAWSEAHGFTLLDWVPFFEEAYFEGLGYATVEYNRFAWRPGEASRAPFTPEAERVLAGFVVDLVGDARPRPAAERVAAWSATPPTADDVARAFEGLERFFERHPLARSRAFLGSVENRWLRALLQVLIVHFAGDASRPFLARLATVDDLGARLEAEHASVRAALRPAP